MADLVILPGELNITFKRGDRVSWESIAKQAGVVVPLPTTGWRAQVREEPGQSDEAPLATVAVDAADGGDGVLRYTIDSADTIELPELCYWEAEHVATERTWVGGTLKLKEQVAQ